MASHVTPGRRKAQHDQDACDLTLSLGLAGTQGLNILFHFFSPVRMINANRQRQPSRILNCSFHPVRCGSDATDSGAALVARAAALLFDLATLAFVLQTAQT